MHDKKKERKKEREVKRRVIREKKRKYRTPRSHRKEITRGNVKIHEEYLHVPSCYGRRERERERERHRKKNTGKKESETEGTLV